MPLTRPSNGATPNLSIPGESDVAQLNQYADLLTGVMTDQPVTIANTVSATVQEWGNSRWNVTAPQNSPRALGDGVADDAAAVLNALTVATGKGITYFPDPPTNYLIKSRVVVPRASRLMGNYRLDVTQVAGVTAGLITGRDHVLATLTTAPKVGDTSLVFTADPSASGMKAGDIVVITPTTPPQGTHKIAEYVQVAASYTSGVTVPLYGAVSQHGGTTAVAFAPPIFELVSLAGGSTFDSLEGLNLNFGAVGIYSPNALNYLTLRDFKSGNAWLAGLLTREFVQQAFLQDVNFAPVATLSYGWLHPRQHSRDFGAGTSFIDKSYLLNTLISGGVNAINWAVFQTMNNNTLLYTVVSAQQQDGICLAGGINTLSIFNYSTEGNAQASVPFIARTTFSGTNATNTGTVSSATGLTNSGKASFATIKGAGVNGADFYGNIATIVSTTLTFKEPAPVVAPTFQDGGAAATTLKAGAYTFAITYTNGAGETTAGPTASASLALDGNKLTVPDLNNVPWLTGITSVKFYMLTAPAPVVVGLVATKVPITQNGATNTGLYADSASTVAAFSITAGGASETPPGANTANQNLGATVSSVDFRIQEYSDLILWGGGMALVLNAEIGSDNGGGVRYSIHDFNVPLTFSGQTGNPIYDPGVVVSLLPGASAPLRRPVGLTIENFATPTFAGNAPESSRAVFPSAKGGDFIVGLLDSVGNGSGTFGAFQVRTPDGNKTRLIKLDSTGRLYIGGRSATPASSNLNAHVASATVNGSSRDQIGFVTITTDGTGVAAGQNLCRITFASAWEWAPNYVTLVDASTDTTLATVRFTAQNLSATVFDIFNTGGALTASKSYIVTWKAENVSA